MKQTIQSIHRRLTGQTTSGTDRGALDADPRLTEDITRIWNSSKNYQANYEPDTDAAWQKFRALRASDSTAKIVSLHPRRSNRRPWLRIAAAFALFAAVGVLYFQTLGSTTDGATRILTLAGEQSTIMLPDGTQIDLNENSELIYDAENFDRRVTLTGEGFFKVKSDPSNPFFIDTDESEIRVLGTQFNLRAYPGEPCVEVHVEEGKVRFDCKSTGETLELTEAHRAALWTDQMKMDRRTDRTGNALAWKRGSLQFRKTPVNDVLADAERFFGKKIEFDHQSIGDCHLNGRFGSGDWETFCSALSSSLDAKFEEKADGSIKITGGRCK